MNSKPEKPEKTKIRNGSWLVTGLTKDQAVDRYKNKRFRVDYNTRQSVEVLVIDIYLYGGVTLTFCKLIKILAQDTADFRFSDGAVIHAGRLQDLRQRS